MVVPNKVYQAAQVGRAIVTADTPAIREVFTHGESIWTVAPEPRALADALIALSRDDGLRARLADGAREAVRRVAGPAARAGRLRTALSRLVGSEGPGRGSSDASGREHGRGDSAASSSRADGAA